MRISDVSSTINSYLEMLRSYMEESKLDSGRGCDEYFCGNADGLEIAISTIEISLSQLEDFNRELEARGITGHEFERKEGE